MHKQSIKVSFFLLFLMFSLSAKAQYTGGKADGHANYVIPNQLPVGESRADTLSENDSFVYTAESFTATDPDGVFVAIKIVALPTKGKLFYNSQTVYVGDIITDFSALKYTPPSNSSGMPFTFFTYRVVDNDGGLSAAIYTATLHIIANPTAKASEVVTAEDSIYTFLGADLDVTYGYQRNYQAVRLDRKPQHGSLLNEQDTVSLHDTVFDISNWVYHCPQDSNGVNYDSIQYKIIDNEGYISNFPTSIRISILPRNDAPVGADSEIEMNEDAVYTFSDSDFPFFDIDNHNSAGIQLFSDVGYGELLYAGQVVAEEDIFTNVAALRFYPENDANGSPYTNFFFKVMDSSGQLSGDFYKMTINVLPLPDKPLSADTIIEVQEDLTYTFSPASFPFFDADGDAFAGIEICEIPYKGTLKYNNVPVNYGDYIQNLNNLTYLAEPDEFGENYSEISYKVFDNTGLSSTNCYTLTINCLPVNDPPTGASFRIEAYEDIEYTLDKQHFTFSDADPGDSLAAIRITGVEGDGSWNYKDAEANVNTIITDFSHFTFISNPDDYAFNYAKLHFVLRDTSMAESIDTYTISVEVKPTPDNPVSDNYTVTVYEDSLQIIDFSGLYFIDADNDTLMAIKYNNIEMLEGSLYFDEQLVQNNQEILINESVYYLSVPDSNGLRSDSLVFSVIDETGAVSDSVWKMYFDIVPTNDPPHDILISENTFPEEQEVGTRMAYFTSLDIDDTLFTYDLVESNDLSDADNPKFVIVDDYLVNNVILDFEDKSSYYIYVRSTDEGGMYMEKAFSLKITDIYDVGVEIALVELFRIYPNPVSDKLNIEFVDNLEIKAISIYNVAGRAMQVVYENNPQLTHVQTSHLPTGMYYLQLHTNQGVFNHRIVVKH